MLRIIRRMDPRARYLLCALLLTLLVLVTEPALFRPALSNAVGVLAGAIIGYLISSYFSEKASSELQAEAHKLSLIMRALEKARVSSSSPGTSTARRWASWSRSKRR